MSSRLDSEMHQGLNNLYLSIQCHNHSAHCFYSYHYLSSRLGREIQELNNPYLSIQCYNYSFHPYIHHYLSSCVDREV